MAPLAASCHAPAKINLALHVTGRRGDGYHLLDTVVVFAGIGDIVRAEIDPSLPAGAMRLTAKGPFAADLSGGGENLVLRAARRFLAETGFLPEGGLSFELEKNLPVSSGIGGGSADAAAALLVLGKLAGAGAASGEDALDRIATGLGADVPMCLRSAPLIARGIGEMISPLPFAPMLYLLLVNPGMAVSTPEVFARLESRDNPPLFPLPAEDGFIDWLERQRNDLQAPAITIAPEIASVLAALSESRGCLLSRMSGSGATCFGIFGSLAEAERAALQIASDHPKWWVAPTTTPAARQPVEESAE